MNWWQRFMRRAEMDEQLTRELRAHIEQHTDELVAGGMERGEARRGSKILLVVKELQP